MRHSTNFGLLLVLFFMCSGFGLAQSDIPFTLDRALNQRVAAGSVSGTFVDCLGKVAQSFNIAMGISVLKTAGTDKSRTVSYKNTTLREIIEAVAKTEPNYEVFVSDGVVRVATKAIPPAQNFLNLRLPDFSAKGSASSVKATLWTQLNQRISPDPLRGYAGSVFMSSTEPKLNLTFSNATVGEILDSIALLSDFKIWLVTFEDNLNLTPSGFRRTELLFPADPTPDEGQPAWEMLRPDYWPALTAPYVPSSP